MSAASLQNYNNTAALTRGLRSLILEMLEPDLLGPRRFHVAVSGGSMVDLLAQALLTDPIDSRVRFDVWDIFFADERLVSFESEESNYGLFKRKFLDKIPAHHDKPTVYPVSAQKIKEFQESKCSATDVANDYWEQMRRVFATKTHVPPIPNFELMLLGCGLDGHTCSLFPYHKALDDINSWVLPITDSPKPPSTRITLSLSVCGAALNTVFLAIGEAKQDIMKRIFDEQDMNLPCSMLTHNKFGEGRQTGRIYWLTDYECVKDLKYPGIGRFIGRV